MAECHPDQELEAEELGHELYTCLMALTDGARFELVTYAGLQEVYEAWRRLANHWDPLTSGWSGRSFGRS